MLLCCLLGINAGVGRADIVIKDVDDPAPVLWTMGAGDIQYIDSVCIGTDQTGRIFRYTVTATGSGTGGNFYLQGPQPATTDVLSYTVKWSNRAGDTNGKQLTAGLTINRIAQTTLDLSCQTAGVNATVIVTIPQADLLNAPGGDYTGTLNLTVAPQ